MSFLARFNGPMLSGRPNRRSNHEDRDAHDVAIRRSSSAVAKSDAAFGQRPVSFRASMIGTGYRASQLDNSDSMASARHGPYRTSLLERVRCSRWLGRYLVDRPTTCTRDTP